MTEMNQPAEGLDSSFNSSTKLNSPNKSQTYRSGKLILNSVTNNISKKTEDLLEKEIFVKNKTSSIKHEMSSKNETSLKLKKSLKNETLSLENEMSSYGYKATTRPSTNPVPVYRPELAEKSFPQSLWLSTFTLQILQHCEPLGSLQIGHTIDI